MKKAFIIGFILLVVFFAVQDRLAKSAAQAIDSASDMKLDDSLVKNWTVRLEAAFKEADAAFRDGRFTTCARQLRLGRAYFDPAMPRFRNAKYRDGLTLSAWVDQQLVTHGDALAKELLARNPAQERVVDFSGLRDLAAAPGKSKLEGAVADYTKRLTATLSARPIVAVQTRNVQADLRDPLLKVLRERLGADKDTCIVVDAGGLSEMLPNLAGTALCEMTIHYASYGTSFAARYSFETSLMQEIQLEITPDVVLARAGGWKEPMQFQHTETLANEYTFADEELKLDRAGRPVTKKTGEKREHVDGNPPEFAAAWNRYFWQLLLPKLNAIPPLKVVRPGCVSTLLATQEVPTDLNLPLTVAQDSLVLVRSGRRIQIFDALTGGAVAAIAPKELSLNYLAFTANEVCALQTVTRSVHRFELRTGKDLGDVPLAIQGSVVSLNGFPGGQSRAILGYTAPGTGALSHVVVDLATGAVLSSPVHSSSTKAEEATIGDLLGSTNTLVAAKADLSEITVRTPGETVVLNPGSGGWRIVSRTRIVPTLERGPDVAVPITLSNGTVGCVISPTGVLTLPAKLAGTDRDAPLLQLVAAPSRKDENRLRPFYNRRAPGIVFLPGLKRFAVLSENRRTLAFYSY